MKLIFQRMMQQSSQFLTQVSNSLCGQEVARFIDYEYGTPNYAAFDIGNHFNEAVGLGGTLDYEKDYPDAELQRLWVRHYLEV